MVRLPFVRISIHTIPLVLAARFAVSAKWSAPFGPGWLGDPTAYRIVFAATAAIAVAWSLVATSRLRLSTWLGVTVAGLCMYRSVTVYEAHKTFGSVAYVEVCSWAGLALLATIGVGLSTQHIIVERAMRDRDDPLGRLANRVANATDEALRGGDGL